LCFEQLPDKQRSSNLAVAVIGEDTDDEYFPIAFIFGVAD